MTRPFERRMRAARAVMRPREPDPSLDPSEFDTSFQRAVQAMDAGDISALERLLDAAPGLVLDRNERPGAWLCRKHHNAVKTYFRAPFLLWFIAGDPPREIPPSTRTVLAAQAIIRRAQSAHAATLQDQLDSTLGLVFWSRTARRARVQHLLLEELVNAGAAADGVLLATALCLRRFKDVARLARAISPRARQLAFIVLARNGKVKALKRAIWLGVELDAASIDFYPHMPAIHHAVLAASLPAVRALVEAGAALEARDTLRDGSPLDWAKYYLATSQSSSARMGYAAIAAYLRHARRQRPLSGRAIEGST